MPRSKLKNIQALHQLSNVAQINHNDITSKLRRFLKKNQPLGLELGCGQGEYTLALARQNPDQLFIGLDIQGERLWYGASQALRENLTNVLFVRAPIEKILEYFPAKTIEQIWLTFPDPYPKKRHTKKRLTAPIFLDIYKKLLLENGLLHLKTDDLMFFQYSLETIRHGQGKIVKKIKDIYKQKKLADYLQIQTSFEKKHRQKNKKIYYLQAVFKINPVNAPPQAGSPRGKM